MWRDKIIEQKKQKNISTKTIAEKTKLSEKTIGRILKGETLFPSVDTVLDIGAADTDKVAEEIKAIDGVIKVRVI